LEVAVVVVV
jgi:hypothetical protein